MSYNLLKIALVILDNPNQIPLKRLHEEMLVTTNPQSSLTPQRSNLEDIENPLYLSSNENANAILVNPPLTGSVNYGSWNISMRVALEVKNKWSVVDGSITTPDRTSSQYAAWRRCNLMVCSWIRKSVHPTIAQSIMYMDKAREVWNDLSRRFSQQDPHRISILQSEIYSLKQENLTVNDYYTKCKTLWEQMNELQPLPICKCDPRCSCDLVDQIRNEREVDQIIRFLQGLNEDYNSLKSGVLVLDPLPEMHKVFVMAEKFERQLNIVNLNLSGLELGHANSIQTNQADQANTGDIVAAVNQFGNRRIMNASGGNKAPKCTFCGMTGHTVEKCYKKHGYPSGWIPGFKSKGKQQIAAATSIDSSGNVTSDQLQKLISLL
ncbi:PREDICTED: uncharacterized protein LOC109183150 [Ipomoea nil]|uniref:uncharacterized protein LOC109183150 n=1 Tax=Ipomoea nil TaxID=35883 RepID=UPI0009014B65|nr:PREDICTED: uncharacterized protein LOC109183150 [Ipomoea nil]